MPCRYRRCTTRLTADQDRAGAYFCRAGHRTAEFKARQADDVIATRTTALDIIRKMTTAALLRDESRLLALAVEGEHLLRPRTAA